MKQITALIALLLFSNAMHSQSLEGTWIGYFTNDRDQTADMRYTYVLVFSPTNDTTYQAVSVTYTKNFNKKDTVSCLLKGSSISSDMVHLEETSIVKSTMPATEQCAQHMDLSFIQTKKESRLQGKWWAVDAECGTGTIYLVKQKIK